MMTAKLRMYIKERDNFTCCQCGPKNNSVNYGIMFIGFALAGYFGPQIMRNIFAATNAIDVDIHNKKSMSSVLNLIPIEDAINWNVYVAYEKTKAFKHLFIF